MTKKRSKKEDKAAAAREPLFEVRQSPVHGNGVFAREHIAAG